MNKKSLEKDMTFKFYMTLFDTAMAIGSLVVAIVALICGSAYCIGFGSFGLFWLMFANDDRNGLKDLLAEYGQLENDEV